MGQYTRTLPKTTDVGAVLAAAKAVAPALKFDGTDGSYVNSGAIEGDNTNILVRIVFPDANNPNIQNAAFDTALATAQGAVDTDKTELQQAKDAIIAINTFLALGAPTNPQILAQVTLLSRVCKKLIQRVL